MKKSLLLLLISILIFPAFSQAQFIGPVTVKYLDPVAGNDLVVIAEVTMPSQPAFRIGYASHFRNDTVHLSACYYSGPATATMKITDTLQIGTLSPGNYTLHFTALSSNNAGQCDSMNFTVKTVSFMLNNTLGTKESKSKIAFLLYPNPAGEMLWVKGENLQSLKITDLLGREIKTIPAQGQSEAKVELSFLPKGIYLLEIRRKDGSFNRERFVKE